VNELARRVMGKLTAMRSSTSWRMNGRAAASERLAGIDEEAARAIEWLDYGVAVCGCAARDGCRIVAENIRETADPRTDLVRSFGIQAYACHPLLAGERVIGTLSSGAAPRRVSRKTTWR